MKYSILLLFLLSWSAFSNVNVKTVIDLNGTPFTIQEKNVKFEEHKTIKLKDIEIFYFVSKNIPNEIPTDYKNLKSIFFDVKVLRNGNKIVDSSQIVTIYDSNASLEITNENGILKIDFIASETSSEKKRRIESISRLPVSTTSVFSVNYKPIDEIKGQLEKLLSKKGKIDIEKETNSIIVKDSLENIIKINKKFKSIDI
jgi:type II secretory pathway component GspD/PulD (secretin)